MPTALADKTCTPCRGGVSPLTPAECACYLVEVPDWQLHNDGRTVARRFSFPDYRTALAFANAVSAPAEETWHHPELVLGWGFCEVSLTDTKNRRPARVRFRERGPYRCANFKYSRFQLATAVAPAKMDSRKCKGVDTKSVASIQSNRVAALKHNAIRAPSSAHNLQNRRYA